MKDKSLFFPGKGYAKHNGSSVNPKKWIRWGLQGNGITSHPYTDEEIGPPQILVVSTYPPRECGIATYTQDLITALKGKFNDTWAIKICALESGRADLVYPKEVHYVLDTSSVPSFKKIAHLINEDRQIRIVLVQHEFGLFKAQENAFLAFLNELAKQVIVVFHTVLPNPDAMLKAKVAAVCDACAGVVVMTRNSSLILTSQYGISEPKISMIPHGTHLVSQANKANLKRSRGFEGRKVLSTFGLLSSGKSIETTLDALPAIVEQCPEVVFLVIGKTHPEVVKSEGERYRTMLEQKVKLLNLQHHVVFVNHYLTTDNLLEYLQLTDIYLFTSNDPNQAVSGTFVYAMSCGCPIISTPIPHAKELLSVDTGVIFDFGDVQQLSIETTRLLHHDDLREHMSRRILQEIAPTAWENSAIAHARLFVSVDNRRVSLKFNLPEISLKHLNYITDDFGIIQFSSISQPDLSYGYTLDDNARAMVTMCMHYKLTRNENDLLSIRKYLKFIQYCQQPEGGFLNYLDQDYRFTNQNQEVNLDDSNGRTVWALGYLISLKSILPPQLIDEAGMMLDASLARLGDVCSTRSMAFSVKGLYGALTIKDSEKQRAILILFANRLVQMFRHEADGHWQWFEGYLTYANSILPESMLYAWLLTHDPVYKEIALTSMSFLLAHTFSERGIEVISNKSWMNKEDSPVPDAAGRIPEKVLKGGQQPIDVAYTIMTLGMFYEVFGDESYRRKMDVAFNWFLGANHLNQIIYNPITGGCCDGLEDHQVNINQGAESTVSYLMARMTIENQRRVHQPEVVRDFVSCTMPGQASGRSASLFTSKI